MVNANFSEAISETLDILNNMEKIYRDKISKKFLNFLEENKSKNYISHLDHSVRIDEMTLKEETKDILAAIYMSYWCDEQEKKDYLNLLNKNEMKYQQELREKYDIDNIFKNKKQETKIENEINIIEYKESFFKRFINKIKRFFHIIN